jgi:NAD(P)-dependent dehydrogenase (short-subunit alcohol dehydrogenase family)
VTYIETLFGLKGKTAAVIGGGGVLAGAMAEGLAKAGADVAILDLNLKHAKKQSDRIKELGVRSLAIQMDVSQKEDVQSDSQNLETRGYIDQRAGCKFRYSLFGNYRRGMGMYYSG